MVFCFVEDDVLYAVFSSERRIKKKNAQPQPSHTRCRVSHRVVVLSSAEDDLLLRGAGRWEVLAAAQRGSEAVRRDLGHCVGDGHAGLLQLCTTEGGKSEDASLNQPTIKYIPHNAQFAFYWLQLYIMLCFHPFPRPASS